MIVLDNIEYHQLNGELHRSDGPAISYDDTWGWYLYGNFHRYYGPAENCNSWWIFGVIVK